MVCMESPALDFKVGVLAEDFIDMSRYYELKTELGHLQSNSNNLHGEIIELQHRLTDQRHPRSETEQRHLQNINDHLHAHIIARQHRLQEVKQQIQEVTQQIQDIEIQIIRQNEAKGQRHTRRGSM